MILKKQMEYSAKFRELASLVGHYDLRARYPADIDEAGGELLGRVLGPFCGGRVLLGRDTRRESEALARSIASGLNQVGCRPDLMGIVPTPVLSFGARIWGIPALMVTPSHNPVGQVGVKGITPQGEIWGEEWDLVRKQLLSGRPSGKHGPATLPSGESNKRRTRNELEVAYLASVRKMGHCNLKVALDPRGGATTGWARKAMQSIGAEVVSVRDRFSPDFFGDSPEPSPENVVKLSNLILKTGADFGVTFDGDGDRAMFVDGYGRAIPPEGIAILLYANEKPRRTPLVASPDVSHKLSRFARVTLAPVGARNVTKKMKEVGARLGIELSDHYYLREDGYVSDGIRVSCRIALAGRDGKSPLPGVQFPSLCRSIFSFPFPNRKALNLAIGMLTRRWQDSHSLHVGGILLSRGTGQRIFCRASNTDSLLRIVLEADSDSDLAILVGFVKGVMSDRIMGA